MRRWLRRPAPAPEGADPRPAGVRAEDAAARALERLGYRVRARNVRFRFGELDLVCEHGGVLVFVEVKARTGPEHGHPLEAVTPHKQRQLARLAEAYLLGLRCRPPPPCRFDVAAVQLGPDGTPTRVEVVVDAFRADRKPARGVRRDLSGGSGGRR
ncbi:MAG: YraN family protein [Armatimonadota bacterium]|nr:YraN family protein [Armatimonadota bacterium]MDW8156816.1 YraN family protein [Armatimonadota bacterium]